MKIIHFSDPHAGASPDSLSALFDKRIVGTLNYAFKRRFLHNMEIFKKGVEYILMEKPDIAVCTGDITSTGQPAEFNIALEILRPLIESEDIKLIYVPGNHDTYVKNAKCRAAFEAAFTYINGDDISLDAMPVKITYGGCDFILINECRPTNIFLSTGYVTKAQIEKINSYCAEKKERPRILAGHFPLRKRYPLMGFRHKIYNHEKLIDMLKGKEIDLSLCGHTHKAFTDVDESGRGEAGAGSITRTNDLNIIEYDKENDRFIHSRHLL